MKRKLQRDIFKFLHAVNFIQNHNQQQWHECAACSHGAKCVYGSSDTFSVPVPCMPVMLLYTWALVILRKLKHGMVRIENMVALLLSESRPNFRSQYFLLYHIPVTLKLNGSGDTFYSSVSHSQLSSRY